MSKRRLAVLARVIRAAVVPRVGMTSSSAEAMPLAHALARNTTRGDAQETRSPTRTNLMHTQHRLAVTASLLLSAPLMAQTRPAITTDTAGAVRPGRPVPGPVYETAGFSRAVDRGTRTRAGQPGP